MPMIKPKNKKTGTVIILNGPSAAGKSSLQKAIQEYMNEPYISAGIDNFFNDLLPDEHGSLGRKPKGNFKPDDVRSVSSVTVKGKEAIALHVGSIGQKAVLGMHRAIREYALVGNNIVVDYISYEDSWREDLLDVLQNVPAVFVKVNLPLESLEKREQQRATSPVGHARSHYFQVHQNWKYDLEVDTNELSAEEGARKIIEFMKNR